MTGPIRHREERIAKLESEVERLQTGIATRDALITENVMRIERLREALTKAAAVFRRAGYPVYADACEDAVDAPR